MRKLNSHKQDAAYGTHTNLDLECIDFIEEHHIRWRFCSEDKDDGTNISGNSSEIDAMVIVYKFIGIITDVSKLKVVKHLFTYECGVTWLLCVRFNRVVSTWAFFVELRQTHFVHKNVIL